jgi:vancomycin resistance protein YoaR
MPARLVLRLAAALPAAALIVSGAGAAVGHWASESLLPESEEVAVGVRFDGQSVVEGQRPQELVDAHVEALATRAVVVRHGGEVLVDTELGALGLQIDGEAAADALGAIGRRGDWVARVDDAWQASKGRVAVTLPWSLDAEPLARRLAPLKDALDRAPVAARWDFDAGRVVEHEAGVEVDIHATVDAVAQAARIEEGAIDVDLVVRRPLPAAQTDVVAAMDRSQVLARYETVFGFVGNQAGRAKNVARAAAGIHGLVMMPGEEISFNDLVGPRSLENGFAQAGEIYKGEMRMGVGGGTCQVASTFHAAAYFGGLEVVERSPHSRPSGYIGIGLDATVAYPHVDLVMSNPYPFPVAVSATIDEPGRLVVEVHGRQKPAKVDFAAATVGVKKYERKIRTAHWLPEGEYRRKQPGRRGVTVEKIRTIFYADGTRRTETTRDVYPPTNEIYYVAPDTDPDEVLPPLPSDANG